MNIRDPKAEFGFESTTNEHPTMTIPSSVNMVVLKLDGPMLCRTDEVGEICVSSISCGTGYFGLAGKSEQMFKVRSGEMIFVATRNYWVTIDY